MTGIFTLDGVVGFVLSMIILTTTVYMLAQPKSGDNRPLYGLSHDILAVAKESGALDYAVDGTGYGIEEIRSHTPIQVCFEIDVLNASGSEILRNGDCGFTGDVVVAKRSFVHKRRYYIAELRSEYR
ncbi:MAG: hypothetical protein KKD39_00730 [Candidatus Altiarchaeota archaeon]|nr:hypothetical protein [Candidatus Altiarchaeota archaeon]